ncbi:C-type cytochrome, putative [hydrothermal vent metagenome]|uniref:C-type cytochrome, putative n=1 Tax=hydrothermal vent metagenome TaxID=652676 RepID=A0A1W1BGE3_9ZZZZ
MKRSLFFIFFIFVGAFAEESRALLLHGNCTTCHYVDRSISAPAMKIVKKRYKKAFTTKELFVKQMVAFVKDPKEDHSIMIDMIHKYEIMPKITFDEETLNEIASYIYDTDEF